LMKVVLLLWSNFDTDLRTRVRSVVIKTWNVWHWLWDWATERR
jgi:hypothetical protein